MQLADGQGQLFIGTLVFGSTSRRLFGQKIGLAFPVKEIIWVELGSLQVPFGFTQMCGGKWRFLADKVRFSSSLSFFSFFDFAGEIYVFSLGKQFNSCVFQILSMFLCNCMVLPSAVNSGVTICNCFGGQIGKVTLVGGMGPFALQEGYG